MDLHRFNASRRAGHNWRVWAGAALLLSLGNAIAADKAITLGERIYRQGIGSDGQPVQAIVAADARVDGTMLTCVSCHRRSGLGSLEGPVIAWPINGKELWVPRRRAGAWDPNKKNDGPGNTPRWALPERFRIPDVRPAYDEQSLAKVLRTGIDPSGRTLSRAMPRFDLDDRDMAALIAYLKQLSTKTDPGADDQTIHFATVVSDGVAAVDREAMLAVIRAHIAARNTQTRPYARRAVSGPFYKTEKFGAYRKLALDVWKLHGSPDTWRKQLEAYYRQKPVFALLGGMVDGPWEPVHRFSEQHRIPTLFPLTDRPVVSDSDVYTLYFSKGLYQEGERAARFLNAPGRSRIDKPVLQFYREKTPGEQAARGFSKTWLDAGGTALTSRTLAPGESLPVAELVAAAGKGVSVLLWLDAAELLATLDNSLIAELQQNDDLLFASWTLAQKELQGIPESLRQRLLLTYPYSLPEERKIWQRSVDAWLRARKIMASDTTIQDKMYFLGWMLPEALDWMRSEFYRDYFMEAFDMMLDQDYAIVVYPRVSFGPDQRYIAKGCYITRLSPGDKPTLIKVGDWLPGPAGRKPLVTARSGK